jgi:hypothetical protein
MLWSKGVIWAYGDSFAILNGDEQSVIGILRSAGMLFRPLPNWPALA